MTSFAGGTTSFIPRFDVTSKLVIDYARNPAAFPINNYVRVVPVEKMKGYYYKFNADEAARAEYTDARNWYWEDGAEKPTNRIEKLFEAKLFECKRYSFDFNLGDLAIEQADIDMLASYGATAAGLAMTNRARLVINELTTQGNWGNNTDTAGNLAGQWSSATSSNPYIQETLNAVEEKILLATNGMVGRKDMILIVNPTLWHTMLESGEVRDTLAQSPFAREQLEAASQGLTGKIYGFNVVVDDTVVVTSKQGASRANSFALDNDSAIVVSRPDGVQGVEGQASFSTVQIFAKEEMTFESHRDDINRRHIGTIVDNYQPIVVAPESGYYIRDVLA